MSDLRSKTIRLASSLDQDDPVRRELLAVLTVEAGNLDSLLKGVWVEVKSEPVVAIRYYRGRWGAIMRTGLVNSYTDQSKFLYQLKNSLQVPHREAERAYSDLLGSLGSLRGA